MRNSRMAYPITFALILFALWETIPVLSAKKNWQEQPYLLIPSILILVFTGIIIYAFLKRLRRKDSSVTGNTKIRINNEPLSKE